LVELDEDKPEPQPDVAPASSVAVTVWGLALFAGCRAIEIFLEAQSMAGAVGQAVLVEWGSSRLGVAWSAPGTPVAAAILLRRAAIGVAVGLAASAVVFGVLAASRGASFSGVTNVEVSVLAIGLVTAALTAWRDELLLHGIVLRALDGTSASAIARVLACGATSAGAALGRNDATARTVCTAALLGIVFGSLWLRDRGAWQPWSAHAGFRFATGTMLSGGVAHSRISDNAWAGGSAGMLGGTAAVIALAPLAVLALGWTARTSSAQSARLG
jgi:hypothetical protein